MTPHDIDRTIHVAAGVLALGFGLAPLLTVKGGPLHRRFGAITVWLGGLNLVAALVAVALFAPPPALVAAFVAASYQYLSSLRALALRNRGPGWIDAFLTLGGAAACVWLYVTMGPGTRSWSPVIGYSTIGYTACLCAYDASRYLWSRVWSTIRPLDHGLKMTGFYFAMASAGAGNLLRNYQPWSQVLPSLIGMAVMILLAALYLAGSRRAAPGRTDADKAP